MTKGKKRKSRGFCCIETKTTFSVTHEVIRGERLPEVGCFLPLVQVIAHAGPDTQGFSIRRSMLRSVEGGGLLEQIERIAVGSAAWRRSWTDVVGDERLGRCQSVVGTGFETGLDPVEDGTKCAEGRKGGIKI